MSQQKQRLLSQEVQLVGSAVLPAAEIPVEVQKKAFLKQHLQLRGRMAFAHTVPRLCPSPGQTCAGLEGDQQSRRGESDCVCKSWCGRMSTPHLTCGSMCLCKCLLQYQTPCKPQAASLPRVCASSQPTGGPAPLVSSRTSQAQSVTAGEEAREQLSSSRKGMMER